MAFKKVNPYSLNFNPFDEIGSKWMLISAGVKDNWNTMTASWGALGVIWGNPSATCYIRHSRYTKTFVDNSEYFTLSVLKNGNREALTRLGNKSGRDIDKMHDSGLTPVFLDGQPTFQESELVLICRKKCRSEIPPEDMTSDVLEKWYKDYDYHTMYIGEIVSAYIAQPD